VALSLLKRSFMKHNSCQYATVSSRRAFLVQVYIASEIRKRIGMVNVIVKMTASTHVHFID
jgi:hypothetical protein